jgi:hypothetical protein
VRGPRVSAARELAQQPGREAGRRRREHAREQLEEQRRAVARRRGRLVRAQRPVRFEPVQPHEVRGRRNAHAVLRAQRVLRHREERGRRLSGRREAARARQRRHVPHEVE